MKLDRPQCNTPAPSIFTVLQSQPQRNTLIPRPADLREDYYILESICMDTENASMELLALERDMSLGLENVSENELRWFHDRHDLLEFRSMHEEEIMNAALVEQERVSASIRSFGRTSEAMQAHEENSTFGTTRSSSDEQWVEHVDRQRYLLRASGNPVAEKLVKHLPQVVSFRLAARMASLVEIANLSIKGTLEDCVQGSSQRLLLEGVRYFDWDPACPISTQERSALIPVLERMALVDDACKLGARSLVQGVL